MRIWIINHYAIPPSMGGLVRHYYFSKYLREKGHDVKIFTSSKIHNTDINMIQDNQLYLEKDMDGVPYTFVKTSDYKGNGIERIINMLQFPIRIWRVCKKFEKPDIIYTSSPDLFTALSSVIMAKVLRVKKVVEIRDLWPESIVEYNGMSKKNPVIQILYRVEKWIYRNADKIIYTFPGGKQYIKDKKWTKRIDPRKIHHITNGVDIEEFEYNKEKFQVSDPLLDDKNIFKVIYTGSIRKANNIKELIEAMEYLKEEKNIHLFLYGEGNCKEDLEKYCKEKQLEQVHFKGFVEKKYIPYILSKSDLNILNYPKSNLWKYGGSQNKFADYIASEKPICSNIEMGYSIIQKYNCGYEGNIETSKEYADIIYNFYKMSSEEYNEICKNSKKAIRKYDYKILCKKIEDILEDIV